MRTALAALQRAISDIDANAANAKGDIIVRHRYNPKKFKSGILAVLALVLITLIGSGARVWAAGQPSPVDAKRLRDVHDKLIATYYLVYQEDEGPVAVVKPNAGTVCRFKRRFAPELMENRAPAICREALDGKAFDKIPDNPLPGEEIANDERSGLPSGGGLPHFQRYADVTLDPKGPPGRIGYYEFESGAGPGCGLNGIAFLDGNRLENSRRAKALAEAQEELKDCRGSSASLVRTHGENLIEWKGGHALQREVPPRVLLRLVGEKIETVCRVEQRPTYSPETTAR